MKKSIERARTSSEIIHHFAHQTLDTETKGKYWYEGNKLYYGSLCIARILENQKKTVVIRPFNTAGAFGGGNNERTVANAFDESWNIYKYDNILALNSKLTTEDKYKITYYNLKERVLYRVGLYYRTLRLVNTNEFSKPYDWKGNDLSDAVDKYATRLKLPKTKILNYTYNIKHNRIVVGHEGRWGGCEIVEYVDIEEPISFWIDKSKWFTPEQQAEIDFKLWKYKHYKKTTINGTYRDTYNDPIKKEVFEDKVQWAIKNREELAIKKNRLKEEENAKKEATKIEDWFKGGSGFNMWNLPTMLRLSNDKVETTKGATIPIESAKRLYKLYLKIKADKTILIYKPEVQVKVGVYTLNNIYNYDSGSIIKVGCHELHEKEIEEFIERNGLQDWRT